MFESWISDLLASSLGKFIDMRTEHLKMRFTIENASIRADALDHLRLPFQLSHGRIGKLQIQVPWRALQLSPVLVHVTDVRLEATPYSGWDYEGLSNRRKRAKQMEIVAAELRRVSTNVDARSNVYWQIITRIWNTLLKRLQLKIEGIRITFTGRRAAHLPRYMFGMNIEAIRTIEGEEIAESQPRHPHPSQEILKCVSVENFDIFWMADAEEEREESVRVLEPTSLWAFMYLDAQTTPKAVRRMESYFNVDALQWTLSIKQLVSLASFMDDLATWKKRDVYASHRPEGWKTHFETKVSGFTQRRDVNWQSIWKYAIQSIMQDLWERHPLHFSAVRVRRYTAWRREYVPLYVRKLEAESRRQVLKGALCEELERLEALMPVEAIVLFRTIAEESLMRTGTGHSQREMSGQRIRWGLFNALSLFRSPSAADPLLLEAPGAEDIGHLYEELDAEEDAEKSSDQLLTSIEICIDHVVFRFVDEGEELICMRGGTVLTEVHFSQAATTVQARLSHATAVHATTGRFLEISEDSSADPAVTLEVHSGQSEITVGVTRMILHCHLALFKTMKWIQSRLPKLTLSRWRQFSACSLETKRDRVLAQMKSTASSLFPSTAIHFHSPVLIVESAAVSEILVLSARKVEAEWKDQTSPETASLSFLENVKSDDFVEEMVHPFIYSKWTVSVTAAAVDLQSKDSTVQGASSFHLVEPFSATGNVYLNPSVREPSLAFLTSDWRLTALMLNGSPSVVASLLGIISALDQEQPLTIPSKAIQKLAAYSSDGVDLVKVHWTVAENVCMELEDFYPDVFRDKSLPMKVEVSCACSRISASYKEVSSSDDSLLGCFAFVSQTGALNLTAAAGDEISLQCSVQKLNLQDLTDYGNLPPPITFASPRLGRTVNAKEFIASVERSPSGLQATGSFVGVDGNGYVFEAGSHIRSNRGCNSVILSAQMTEGHADYSLTLNHLALGSSFLVRILRFLTRPSGQKGRTCIVDETHHQVLKSSRFCFVSVDSFLAMPLELDATEIGLPGNPTPVLLSLPDLSLKAALTELGNGEGLHCCAHLEVEKFSMRNAAVLTNVTELQSDIYSPLASVSEVQLDSAFSPQLAAMNKRTRCRRTEAQVTLQLGPIRCCVDEASLGTLIQSVTCFDALMRRTFPPEKGDGSSREGTGLKCSFEALIAAEMMAPDLRIFLKSDRSSDPNPFRLLLKESVVKVKSTGSCQEASMSIEEAGVIYSRQLLEEDKLMLKSDGLAVLSSQDNEMAEESKAFPCSGPESLEEEETGSVSSSTSWQTAGSHVSVTRRAGTSLQSPSAFESVGEMEPLPSQDIGHSLSPFVESVSSEESIHAAEPVPEEDETEDADLDLMLLSLKSPDEIIIHATVAGNEIRLVLPSLECTCNLMMWETFLKRLERLQIVVTPRSSAPVSGVTKTINVKAAGLKLLLCLIPLQSRASVTLEPPRLRTALSMESVDVDVSDFRIAMDASVFRLQSSWIQCTDPVCLELLWLRDMETLLHGTGTKVQAALPAPDAVKGVRNMFSLEVATGDVTVSLSPRLLAPVTALIDHVTSWKTLLPPSSSQPLEDDRARSYSLDFSRDLSFLHHFKLNVDCRSFLARLMDDSAESKFPLMRASILDLAAEAESLSGSDIVGWELRFLPELDVYNRQTIGWECCLQRVPWNAHGKFAVTPSTQVAERGPLTYASIQVSAEGPVELSASPGMVTAVYRSTELLTRSLAIDDACEDVPSVSCWIRNLTGSDVECRLANGASEDAHFVVKPNERAPVLSDLIQPSGPQPTQSIPLVDAHEEDLEDYEERVRQSLRKSDMKMSFRLIDQSQLCGPLLLNKPGVFSFKVQSFSALFPVSRDDADPIDRLFNRSAPRDAVLQCSVRVQSEGALEVELHSNIQLKNETAYRLEVGSWRGEEISPLLQFLQPTESLWVPITTVAHGRFAIRPHPASDNRFSLRCTWSRAIYFDQVPEGSSFVRVQCDPVSGGLKPVWLHVAIDRGSDGGDTTIRIQAPVIVHNFLPSPLDVAISCDSGKTTALKGKLVPRSSMQGYTVHGDDVTTIRLVPHGYRTIDINPSRLTLSSSTSTGFEQHSEDLKAEDVVVHVAPRTVPVTVRHRVEALSGRHVFEVRCPLWIYNCTEHRFAVRETASDELHDDVNLENEDVVPDRWVSPLTEALPVGSKMTRSPASASALGLQTLLQKGQPEHFRLRAFKPVPVGAEGSRRFLSRDEYPVMQIMGVSTRGAFRLQFRTSGSVAPAGMDYWSKSVSVDGSGTAAVVRCAHPLHATSTSPAFPRAAYFLAITSMSIPRCGGASAVHVMPRYLLNNSTSFHLQYRRQGIPMENELSMDATQSIHWLDATKPLLLNVRVQEAGWLWSGGLVVDTPGDTMVKLRHRVREETWLVQMDVSLQSTGILLATFMHRPTGFAPYRLDNFTCEKIHVRQHKSGNQEDVLRPYSSMPYAWDEPAGQHKVVLEGPARKLIGVFGLDSIGDEARVVLGTEVGELYSGTERRLRIGVKAEGPTRVLTVLDEDVHPQVEMPMLPSSQPGPCASRFAAVGDKRGVEMSLSLPSLGASLVSTEREMMYLRLKDPIVSVKRDNARTSLRCSVAGFQSDTCLLRTTYPVLAHGPVALETWRGVVGAILGKKAVDFSLSVWRQRPGGVLCLEHLSLELTPVAVNVEERSLRPLAAFLKSLLPQKYFNEAEDAEAVLTKHLSPPKPVPKQKIYVEELSISGCGVRFSFSPGEGGADASNANLLRRVISMADFEGAQITLSPLKLRHPLMSLSTLLALIGRHYTVSLLQEVYKVVGSADILGDPVHLVQRLGLGVWLLVANPTYAIVQSRSLAPWRLLTGFTSGVTSLLSNVSFALANAAAKMSQAAKKMLLLVFRLEVDSASARRRPDLLRVVLEGCVEVLSSAARGLDEGGIPGFFKGALTGVAGLVVRPAALVLEEVSDICDSVARLVSGTSTQSLLCRLPRDVQPGKPLRPYNEAQSIGAAMLREIWNGELREEALQGCFCAAERWSFLLVTRHFFLAVRWKTPMSRVSRPLVTLAVPLECIECVSRRAVDVSVFGFSPSSLWTTRTVLTGPETSPFFSEKVRCTDLAASCRLSVMLKVACEAAPRTMYRLGNGFYVRYM